MVQLLAAEKGDAVLLKYQHAIEKEYAFWMEGEKKLSAENSAHRRVVRLPDGSILNRYWDDKDTPRPEAFLEDRELAEKAGGNPATVYRHIRAAAESGWDFSSRWFKDGNDMATIQTTNLFARGFKLPLAVYGTDTVTDLFNDQSRTTAYTSIRAKNK